MAIIILDPGHGGTKRHGDSDPTGATGPSGLQEKTVNLQVSTLVRDVLGNRGHNAMMTRNDDQNVGLADRAKFGSQREARAFVSIHFNAFDKKTQGTETLIYLNQVNDESKRLASCLQNSLVAALRYKDRGTTRKELGVLNPRHHKETTAVALVESSFMDIPDEEARLRTHAHQSIVANAISAGIELFVGSPQEWGPRRYEPHFSKLAILGSWLGLVPSDQDI